MFLKNNGFNECTFKLYWFERKAPRFCIGYVYIIDYLISLVNGLKKCSGIGAELKFGETI